VHDGPITAVEAQQSLGYDRVVARQPIIVSNIVQPGRRVKTLHPDFRVGQVAKQDPVSRAVTPPDPSAVGHYGEEFGEIGFGDPPLDPDHHRPRAPVDRNGGRRRRPTSQRTEVASFGVGQRK
jgi:hypothetical protein